MHIYVYTHRHTYMCDILYIITYIFLVFVLFCLSQFLVEPRISWTCYVAKASLYLIILSQVSSSRIMGECYYIDWIS